MRLEEAWTVHNRLFPESSAQSAVFDRDGGHLTLQTGRRARLGFIANSSDTPRDILSRVRWENTRAGGAMSDFVVQSLILDLLEWVAKQDRSYDDTMDAWRTSCPKLPVWEDATDRGLIERDANMIRLTPAGRAFLKEHRLCQ